MGEVMSVADMADGWTNYRHNATKRQAVQIQTASLEQLADRCGGRVALAWPRFWQRRLIIPTRLGRRPGHVGSWLVENKHPHEFYAITDEVFRNEYSACTSGD